MSIRAHRSRNGNVVGILRDIKVLCDKPAKHRFAALGKLAYLIPAVRKSPLVRPCASNSLAEGVHLLVVAFFNKLLQRFKDIFGAECVGHDVAQRIRQKFTHILPLKQRDKRTALAAHMGSVQQVGKGIKSESLAVKSPCILRVKEEVAPLSVHVLGGDLLAVLWVIAESLVVVARPVLVGYEYLHRIILHEILYIHKFAEFRKCLIVGEILVEILDHLCIIAKAALGAFFGNFCVAYYFVLLLVAAEMAFEVVLVVVFMEPCEAVVFAV